MAGWCALDCESHDTLKRPLQQCRRSRTWWRARVRLARPRGGLENAETRLDSGALGGGMKAEFRVLSPLPADRPTFPTFSVAAGALKVRIALRGDRRTIRRYRVISRPVIWV